MERSHTGVTIGGFNFSKLRADIYPIIHNKDITINDLVWLWDFFKEHEVIIETIIKEERWPELIRKLKPKKEE